MPANKQAEAEAAVKHLPPHPRKAKAEEDKAKRTKKEEEDEVEDEDDKDDDDEEEGLGHCARCKVLIEKHDEHAYCEQCDLLHCEGCMDEFRECIGCEENICESCSDDNLCVECDGTLCENCSTDLCGSCFGMMCNGRRGEICTSHECIICQDVFCSKCSVDGGVFMACSTEGCKNLICPNCMNNVKEKFMFRESKCPDCQQKKERNEEKIQDDKPEESVIIANCAACDTGVKYEDEHSVCKKCDRVYCKKCSGGFIKCNKCETSLCEKCSGKGSCVNCKKKPCEACSTACVKCEEPICNASSSTEGKRGECKPRKCVVCSDLYCEKCCISIQFVTCDRFVCKTVICNKCRNEKTEKQHFAGFYCRPCRENRPVSEQKGDTPSKRKLSEVEGSKEQQEGKIFKPMAPAPKNK